MALIAKNFAMKDYEVFGMDMRGHGDSGGPRGTFESAEQLYADEWKLIETACSKYDIDHNETPLFLFGRSLGGLIASNMICTEPRCEMFAGAILLSPFYADRVRVLDTISPLCGPLSWIMPQF